MPSTSRLFDPPFRLSVATIVSRSMSASVSSITSQVWDQAASPADATGMPGRLDGPTGQGVHRRSRPAGGLTVHRRSQGDQIGRISSSDANTAVAADVLKLDVARPCVPASTSDVRREPSRLTPSSPRDQEVLRQARDVLGPRPQRRHLDRQDVEAEERVAAETSGIDLRFEITVGGGDQPHVDDWDWLDPTRSRSAPAGRRSFADSGGISLISSSSVPHPRVRTALRSTPVKAPSMPEELALQQTHRQGGTIDREEGAVATQAGLVDVTCGHPCRRSRR